MAGTVPKNFHLVEGDWKGFLFRRVKPSDYELLLDFLKNNFLQDEPTCALLGFSEEFGNEMEVMVKDMLKDGLSFVVESKENGDLAALRINYQSKPQRFGNIPLKSYAGKELLRMDRELEKLSDLKGKYNVKEEHIARFFAASTSPKYRNLGIAGELYRRCLDFFKAEGYNLAYANFTNKYARRSARALGFEEVCRVYYADLKTVDGKDALFEKDKLNHHHYNAVMVKKF